MPAKKPPKRSHQIKPARPKKVSGSAKSAKPVSPVKPAKKSKPAKRSFKPVYILPPPLLGESVLDQGLKLIRQGKSLNAVAKIIGVSPGRLRRHGTKTGSLRKKGRRWVIHSDRRQRQMPIFSKGKELTITLPGYLAAAKVGRYLAAVRQFLLTNDPDYLKPFVGDSVVDSKGKSHLFETRPNVLYRLDASGTQPFEQVYRIVA